MSPTYVPFRSCAFKTLLALLMWSLGFPASAAETTFVVNPQQSSLSITVSTMLGNTKLSDIDTQNLGGTIETSLSFSSLGGFPATAEIAFNSGAVSPLDAFRFTLGLPPLLGVNVAVKDAVVDLSTTNPPIIMNQLPTGLLRYGFDAAELVLTMNQGSVETTGAIQSTIDLAANPVMGVAPPGTFGTLTFLNLTPDGTLTQIDAQLQMPIRFIQEVEVEAGQMVTLDATGEIIADGSFVVNFSGAPEDLNIDGFVDGLDLGILLGNWDESVGTNGGELNGTPPVDGLDLGILLGAWRPPSVATHAVHEPAFWSLLAGALALHGTRRARV